jgi:hypothetical protein
MQTSSGEAPYTVPSGGADAQLVFCTRTTENSEGQRLPRIGGTVEENVNVCRFFAETGGDMLAGTTGRLSRSNSSRRRNLALLRRITHP